MCGATSGQNQQASASAGAYNTAVNNAQSVFGSSNKVFSDLMSTFSPTVAAGPSQNGFSGQTLSNLNSQAVTQTGQEAQNEKAAVGNAEAATSPTSNLPSGGQIGSDLSISENAGNQTASELSQIQLANEQQGNANYKTAVAGLEGATGVFSPATGATEAASSAGNTAGTAVNSVANANQSPWQLAAGALGGVVAAAPSYASAFGGGSNTDAGTPGSNIGLMQSGNNLSTTNPTVTAGVE
jgi:hypothetical protein